MDFRDSEQVSAGDVATVIDEVVETVADKKKAPQPKADAVPGPDPVSSAPLTAAPLTSSSVQERRFHVVTDASRDALLTEFGKETLRDRYLLPGR
jgi:ribonucleoside-diphosphate reductase alpha chain